MPNMKLRHTAALALVGWYLMVPPGPIHPDPILPAISKWEMRGSFDTAIECEDKRGMETIRTANAIKDGRDLNAPETQMAAQYMLAQCIASDDPRLKEK
jgi:hypothetical protein